jgi:rhodanese-related sulfurtransferase
LPQDQPILTMCQTGYRAELAASMIAVTGREVIAVREGMGVWNQRGWPSQQEVSEVDEGHDPLHQTHAHSHA